MSDTPQKHIKKVTFQCDTCGDEVVIALHVRDNEVEVALAHTQCSGYYKETKSAGSYVDDFDSDYSFD